MIAVWIGLGLLVAAGLGAAWWLRRRPERGTGEGSSTGWTDSDFSENSHDPHPRGSHGAASDSGSDTDPDGGGDAGGPDSGDSGGDGGGSSGD